MSDNYESQKDPGAKEKLLHIAKESPQLPIGLVALVAIVGHGLYNLKGRREKVSVYLIRYRLLAQGTFLGCISLGLAYTMFKNHVWKKLKKE